MILKSLKIILHCQQPLYLRNVLQSARTFKNIHSSFSSYLSEASLSTDHVTSQIRDNIFYIYTFWNRKTLKDSNNSSKSHRPSNLHILHKCLSGQQCMVTVEEKPSWTEAKLVISYSLPCEIKHYHLDPLHNTWAELSNPLFSDSIRIYTTISHFIQLSQHAFTEG